MHLPFLIQVKSWLGVKAGTAPREHSKREQKDQQLEQMEMLVVLFEVTTTKHHSSKVSNHKIKNKKQITYFLWRVC